MTRIPTVWHRHYTCDAAPLTSTTKQARVVACLQKADGGPSVLDILDSHSAFYAGIWGDIARVHAPGYVEAVRTGQPRDLAESQWFSWSPEFARSVAYIWIGHQRACEWALDRRSATPMVLHPASGAHHAKYAHGAGFCTFNYIVGASKKLLDAGRIKSVGVIDLDAHFGDGTVEMTVGDDRFAHFDISGSGLQTHAGEAGRVRQYRVGTSADYMELVYDPLQAWLDEHQPQLVHYQAGADPYLGDSVGGIAGMTIAALERRDRAVLYALAQRHIPTVVTFAGGYVPGKTEQVHLNTVRAMYELLNPETPPLPPASTLWRERERTA